MTPAKRNRGICKHMGAILVRLDLEAEMELASAAATEDREKAEAGDRLEDELAAIGL